MKIYLGGSELMLSTALEEAKNILHTDHLESHQDFLMVEPQEGKNILIGDIMPVVEKGANPPAVGDKAVAIINHAELLSVDSQNKLLKTLEESAYIEIILVSYKDTLLKTVKSRCQLVEYKPLTYDEFCDKYNGLSEEDLLFFSFATDRYPVLADALLANASVYGKIYNSIATGKPHELFRLLDMVNNKGTGKQMSKDMMRSVLSLMQKIYLKVATDKPSVDALEMIRFLNKEIGRVYHNTYLYNDFFYAMVCCVEGFNK